MKSKTKNTSLDNQEFALQQAVRLNFPWGGGGICLWDYLHDCTTTVWHYSYSLSELAQLITGTCCDAVEGEWTGLAFPENEFKCHSLIGHRFYYVLYCVVTDCNIAVCSCEQNDSGCFFTFSRCLRRGNTCSTCILQSHLENHETKEVDVLSFFGQGTNYLICFKQASKQILY